MKKNEFYRNKWNYYVAKITEVKRDRVELIAVNSGVRETIARENFDLNYTPCTTIYQWRKTLEQMFSFATIKFIGDSIRVLVDDTKLDFSISISNMFTVSFTDDIKEAIDADTNMLRFLLEDADTVIQSFAELFEE